MNFIIYKMELRRNLKSFIIWSAAVCGTLFLGMLFYPAINADGILSQMDALFENPMLKAVLAAFGADVSALGSLSGFYVTYNSIYNVLLGCIFAGILAANLLAREEADKTADFLFTRPVTRACIFRTKSAVLLTYVTLFTVLFFVFSAAALEAVKKESPRVIDLSKKNKGLVIKQIEKHPDRIYDAFKLNAESFNEYSRSYALKLLGDEPEGLDDMNLDAADMNSLLEKAMDDPEAFFTSALEEPEAYMSMFSFPPEQREQFLEHVKAQEEEYYLMRESFFSEPDVFLMYFDENPGAILEQFKSEPGSMVPALSLLALPPDFENQIFKKYSLRKLLVMCIYFYFLFICTSCIILFMSLILPRGRQILGPALGLIFILYFLNSISSAASGFSDAAAIIGWLSPFSWIDTDITSLDYRINLMRLVLFSSVSAAALFGACRRLAVKDLLV